MRASRFLAVGLFVVVAVVVVEAQQPGRGFGGGQGGGINGLVLNNKDLQAELKITDEQKDKFKVVVDKQTEMGKKMREAFKDAGGDKDKQKEAFAAMQKDGEKLQAEVKAVVESTLTADQKKRLKEIDRQRLGVRAFSNDDLVADLKLTDTQKTKIKTISDEYSKDASELFKGGFGKGGFDKEKMAENQKKREKLSKAAMADIDEVLTDDQKKAWKDLTGAAFDVSKLNQGFGGGRFGGQPKSKD